MSLRAGLVLLWLSFPILPGWALVTRGSSHDTKLLLSLGGLYALASFLLASALARQERLSVLRAFLRSRTAVFLLAGFILALAVLGLTSSVVTVGAAALIAATWFLVSWRASPDAATLIEKTHRLMLLAASCVFAAAAGEALMRIPGVADSARPLAHRIANIWPPERYDAHAFVPMKGRVFRSLHLQEPRTPGAIRIVTLGDSFTWGEKIADTRRIWPYVLESTLAEQGIRSEVLNLSQRGATTVNEVEYLQRFGWDLGADAVVLQYLINDPLPSWPDFRHADGRYLRDETAHLAVSYTLHKWLDRRSYLYSLADQRFADLQVALFDLKDLDYFDLHADRAPPWEATKAAIRTLGEECRKRQVPVLFVMFPYFQQGSSLGATYPYRELHAKLRATVEAEGVPFLDLLGAFAEVDEDADAWHVLPMDSHPGIAGHELAGRAIARELIAVGGFETESARN